MSRINLNNDYWLVSSRGAIILTHRGDQEINNQLNKLHADCPMCKSPLCCKTYEQGSVIICSSNITDHHRKLPFNISRDYSKSPKVVSINPRGPG